MTTWPELVSYVRDKYSLSHDEDDRFALIFSFPDDRSQQVFCRLFEAFDQECVEIRTPVCEVGQMDPEQALKMNAGFALGGLAIESGMVFMMYSLILRDLDLEQFDLQMQVIGACADDLEKDHTGADEY